MVVVVVVAVAAARVGGVSELCKNQSLAQEFLTKLRELITTLESNDTNAEVLEERANAVAYVKSDTNAAVLSSNCTGYFDGLKHARKLDAQAEAQQEIYEENAERLYKKMLQSIFGPHNFLDDNF